MIRPSSRRSHPRLAPPGVLHHLAAVLSLSQRQTPPEPIGALVAEWFSSSSVDDGKRARVELVAEHGSLALANALEHTGLPLYGLPNLTYEEVDKILAYRAAAGGIDDPAKLVSAQVLSDRKLLAISAWPFSSASL
jgi:hypothetical protein